MIVLNDMSAPLADVSSGLGRALASTFLARSSVTVIAAVRNTSHETSKSLDSLPKGSNSHLILTQYDAQNEKVAADLAAVLEQEKVSHLDVVIANAGIANDFHPLASVPLTAFKDHVEINAYGPLLLFQAVKPLLDKAKQPKFVALGSPLGSIGGMEMRPYPMGAYGASKAMLHYIMRKVHLENETLISFPVDPGCVKTSHPRFSSLLLLPTTSWNVHKRSRTTPLTRCSFVQTDMGNENAKVFGMEKAFVTIEDSTTAVVAVIDNATRESTFGKFASWNGEEFPW